MAARAARTCFGRILRRTHENRKCIVRTVAEKSLKVNVHSFQLYNASDIWKLMLLVYKHCKAMLISVFTLEVFCKFTGASVNLIALSQGFLLNACAPSQHSMQQGAN